MKIGIVSPSFVETNHERINKFIDILINEGFEVEIGKSVFASYGYLAGTDLIRATDINEMFSRTDIDIIVCYKGGYGATRILNLLDYQLIKNNPKPFIGYSDITALLNAINKLSNVVTIHGEMGLDIACLEQNDITYIEFFNSLRTSDFFDLIDPRFPQPTILCSGKTTAKIVGGNITLICATMGTKYEIEYQNNILFLEDVDEEPYAIDRYLSSLSLLGVFTRVSGIILGTFKNCIPSTNRKSCQLINDIIMDYFKDLKIPIIYNFPSGHQLPFKSIPIGLEYFYSTENNKVIIKRLIT